MWANLQTAVNWYISLFPVAFALFTSGSILSAVLVIGLVRKVLRTFNII